MNTFWEISMWTLLAVGILFGAKKLFDNRPSKPVVFSDNDIVRKNGEIWQMTQDEAIEYCKRNGGHLPTTRELAQFMNPDAILEVDEVNSVYNGKAPKGYYRVECQNEDGVDIFYFNNEKGRNGEAPRQLTGDLSKYSFWTSSRVLGKPDYAHVFYGPIGGGGGAPEDHKRDRLHAVICMR